MVIIRHIMTQLFLDVVGIFRILYPTYIQKNIFLVETSKTVELNFSYYNKYPRIIDSSRIQAESLSMNFSSGEKKSKEKTPECL